MKVKVAEASGLVLKALVALADGADGVRLHTYRGIDPGPPVWVADFEHDWIELANLEVDALWILQRERLSVTPRIGYWESVRMDFLFEEPEELACFSMAADPETAILRCWITHALGLEVEIPDELGGAS